MIQYSWPKLFHCYHYIIIHHVIFKTLVLLSLSYSILIPLSSLKLFHSLPYLLQTMHNKSKLIINNVIHTRQIRKVDHSNPQLICSQTSSMMEWVRTFHPFECPWGRREPAWLQPLFPTSWTFFKKVQEFVKSSSLGVFFLCNNTINIQTQ